MTDVLENENLVDYDEFIKLLPDHIKDVYDIIKYTSISKEVILRHKRYDLICRINNARALTKKKNSWFPINNWDEPIMYYNCELKDVNRELWEEFRIISFDTSAGRSRATIFTIKEILTGDEHKTKRGNVLKLKPQFFNGKRIKKELLGKGLCRCVKCNEIKKIEDMLKNPKCRIEFANYCKDCSNKLNKNKRVEKGNKVIKTREDLLRESLIRRADNFMNKVTDYIKENYVIITRYSGIKTPLLVYSLINNEIYKVDSITFLTKSEKEIPRHYALHPDRVFWKEVEVHNERVYGDYVLEEYNTPHSILRCKKYNFLYKMVNGSILKGVIPNITHALDKNEYYKKITKELNLKVTVCDDIVYTNSHDHINVKCNKCGKISKMSPQNISLGRCFCKCDSLKLDSETIFRRINETSKYGVEVLSKYKGGRKDLKLKCLNCGGVYNQRAVCAFRHDGCVNCRDLRSKGEIKIQEYLTRKNIKHQLEYRVDECCYELRLPFDFYLPNKNILIEFDGEQHFREITFFGGLELRMRNDKIKNEYCLQNDIKLLRIKHSDLKWVSQILDEYIPNPKQLVIEEYYDEEYLEKYNQIVLD